MVDTFISGDFALQPQVESYISAQARLQAKPKFNVDESAFTGPWGRLQRDGLALRVSHLFQANGIGKFSAEQLQ